MSNPASKAKEGLRRHSVSRSNRALDLSGGAFAVVMHWHDLFGAGLICKLRNSWRKPLCNLQSLGEHTTPNGKSHNPRTAVCDCPCSRSRHSQQEPHCPGCFTGVIAISLAAALHPRNVCCTTGPLRSRQGILHYIPLCTRHTCDPNQCKQHLFQLAGCAWTLLAAGAAAQTR